MLYEVITLHEIRERFLGMIVKDFVDRHRLGLALDDDAIDLANARITSYNVCYTKLLR